jgi:hypothetical protein
LTVKDPELLDLLTKTAAALDEEAAWLVDVDIDGHGRDKPTVPAADMPYREAVTDTAEELRTVAGMLKARIRDRQQ